MREPVETAAPSRRFEIRRVFAVFGHALATVADVGMLVLGTGLVSLAVAVLLDGFGTVTLGLTTSTGAMFGSALVLAVFGFFALGVATERPVGQSRWSDVMGAVEITAARLVAILSTGFVVWYVGGYLVQFLTDLPLPFELGTEVIKATGLGGMVFGAIVGVPAMLAVRLRFAAQPWLEEIELPILYVVWLLGAMVFVARVL